MEEQQATQPKKPIYKKWWFWVGGVILLFIFLGLIGGDDTTRTTTVKPPSMTLAEAKDRAIEVSYDDLLRNNERYMREVIYYRGKIVQADSLWGDNYVLRINVTRGEYGFWDNDVWVNYRGSRVLEDDIVDFWGMVKGIKRYKTVLGASRSIPEIDALYLEMADSPTAQIIDSQPQAQQQTQSAPAAERQAPAPPGPGSRSNPIPIGTTVRVGDWNFKVLSSTPNATQAITAHNMFNDPPKAGHQFFMARIEATYVGSASDELSWSFSFGAVGDSAVAYSRLENSCGVIPDDLSRTGEVFAGGTVAGNICWEVRAGDVNSLVMFADPSFSFGDSERVFMSLPK